MPHKRRCSAAEPYDLFIYPIMKHDLSSPPRSSPHREILNANCYSHMRVPDCHPLNELCFCADSAAIEAPFLSTVGLFGCDWDKWDQSCWWSLSCSSHRRETKKKKKSVSWLRNPHGRHFRNGRKGWNSPAAHWFNKYLPKLCQDGEITLSAAASLLSRRVGKKNNNIRINHLQHHFSRVPYGNVSLCVCLGISCQHSAACRYSGMSAFKCILEGFFFFFFYLLSRMSPPSQISEDELTASSAIISLSVCS